MVLLFILRTYCQHKTDIRKEYIDKTRNSTHNCERLLYSYSTYCQVPVQGVAHGQCEVLRQQEGPGQAAALRRGGGRPAADGRGLHIQVGPDISLR